MKSSATPLCLLKLRSMLQLKYECGEGDSAISFWHGGTITKQFDKLYPAAVRAVSVSASSSFVETVFYSAKVA